ncbi:Nif3-like dinuclear metal center hexameric protein [Aquibacillus albus]|uniref:GTP cyclohydrolase 1 type 2 homolog n=1 Tax=Aquibacillus albus TaxID=1168171 RepID=A0ABS2MUW3_9BACI|nr:Nif3-like dinuclear metal center hexameric protein [Aquibacillus albus]MBM7569641.1 dinuclear metal center YbgI/SA1388 family protein [Aquibacillus albus]
MGKAIPASKLITLFESWAPKHLAYEWDNVGLQVGSLNKPVKKVMVTLDVLENVVNEAIEKNVDLIIAHHPLLFEPLKQVDINHPKGRIIEKLLKHNITVYAAHTNLDIVTGGVSDILMKKLNIDKTDVLIKSETEKLIKLIVYVPETHAANVTSALGDAGAGHIGQYSHCSFQSKGVGAFKALEGTNPFIGEKGEIEKVNEIKLETIIKENQLSSLLAVLKDAHPYEEVAYDLIPLLNNGEKIGAGRIGSLKESMSLGDFCEFVKNKFEVPALRVTGDLESKIKKVALLGGSGKGFIHVAKRMGADVYVTGDMTFHEAQDAWQMGLHVIDPGHHVEKFMRESVKFFLEDKITDLDASVQVIVSKENTEPFQFM